MTYKELEKIVVKQNNQRVIINTFKNGVCTKCKIVCKKEHHSLEIEYQEIRQVIKNLKTYRIPQRCYNHEQETYHIPFRCPKNECEKCGKSGHARQMCDNELYFWNRLSHCGCDLRTIKRNKSRLQNGGGNHCCFCLTPIKFKEAYSHYGYMKLKCKDCYNGKRPLTPELVKEEKKVRFNLPEPEDPMENMDLDPIPQSHSPKKGEFPEEKCLECGRSERTMNPINELGICQKCETKRLALERYGSKTTIRQCQVCKKHTDTYQSRAGVEIVCGQECNDVLSTMNRVYKDKSGKLREQIIEEKIKVMVSSYENEDQEEDDDDITKLTLMVNKYLNNEFENIPYHPKQEIEKVLNEKLPIELVEMVTENNKERVELWNTEPIKTNEINIEWLEGSVLTQPWELTREFEWKDENPIIDNEFQELLGINNQVSDFEPQIDLITRPIGSIDEEKVKRQDREDFQINLGNNYLQQCKIIEETIQEIKEREEHIEYISKEYENIVQEYEEVIKALILENELVKKELEEEKLVNQCINQYMYPSDENITMEICDGN